MATFGNELVVATQSLARERVCSELEPAVVDVSVCIELKARPAHIVPSLWMFYSSTAVAMIVDRNKANFDPRVRRGTGPLHRVFFYKTLSILQFSALLSYDLLFVDEKPVFIELSYDLLRKIGCFDMFVQMPHTTLLQTFHKGFGCLF